jgi:photosystem II stability/assembly factor-like uncharacterized protein
VNDDFETRFGLELARRLTPPPAPDRLYAHVRSLGRPETEARPFRRAGLPAPMARLRLLTAAAAVVTVVALVGVGLVWRGSGTPGPGGGGSPVAGATPSSTVPASGSPSASFSDVPPATATPTRKPPIVTTWSGPAPEIEMMGRVDTTFGWAVAADGLYVTDDGGASWDDRTPPTLVGKQLITSETRSDGAVTQVRFIDRSHGWIAYETNGARSASFQLYGTADGGRTWTTRAMPTGEAPWLEVEDAEHLLVWNQTSVQPAGSTDPNDAYSTSLIWASADSGTTWKKLDATVHRPGLSGTEPLPALAEVHVVSTTEAWAIALPATLLHTLDGGLTWSASDLPMPLGSGAVNPLQIDAPPARFGSAMVAGALIWPTGASATKYVTWTSSDGGTSWAIASTTALPGQRALPTQTRLQTGLLALQDIANAPKTIHLFSLETHAVVASMDASAACPVDGPSFVSLVDASDVWLTCSKQAGLYASTDGGQSWQPLMGEPGDQPL